MRWSIKLLQYTNVDRKAIDSNEMPSLERPPSYTSVDPRQNESPSRQEQLKPKILELHRARDHARSLGIHVKQDDSTLYYVGHYNNPSQSSDIILLISFLLLLLLLSRHPPRFFPSSFHPRLRAAGTLECIPYIPHTPQC